MLTEDVIQHYKDKYSNRTKDEIIKIFSDHIKENYQPKLESKIKDILVGDTSINIGGIPTAKFRLEKIKIEDIADPSSDFLYLDLVVKDAIECSKFLSDKYIRELIDIEYEYIRLLLIEGNLNSGFNSTIGLKKQIIDNSKLVFYIVRF